MPHLYEGMFLIDNDAVRADWAKAKAVVSDTIAKHGGTVKTSRRWDERKLAYPIHGKHRATYLLAYYEMDPPAIQAFLRELEIRETVLRHLQLRVEAVPEGETELSEAELAADFQVPEPPVDEPPPIAPELFERERERERERDRDRDRERRSEERPAEGEAAPEGQAAPEGEKPAEKADAGSEEPAAKAEQPASQEPALATSDADADAGTETGKEG